MRLLHYLEIRNFKHFGDRQRIELDHPAVLIGPNNCGKTTAIQAIALWSLDELILERVFDERQFPAWKRADAETAQVLWDARTATLKLSDFAEEFFRRLGQRLGHPMLLRKSDLYRLIRNVTPAAIPPEVATKLDLMHALFDPGG